jgi:hypothetical protein
VPNSNRTASAILTGILIGGVSSGLVVSFLSSLQEKQPSFGEGVAFLFGTTILVTIFAGICFAIGIVVVGLPTFLLVSRLGARTAIVFSLLGAAEVGVVCYLLFDDGWFTHLDHGRTIFAVLMSLVGGIVAMTIWQKADGRVGRSIR